MNKKDNDPRSKRLITFLDGLEPLIKNFLDPIFKDKTQIIPDELNEAINEIQDLTLVVSSTIFYILSFCNQLPIDMDILIENTLGPLCSKFVDIKNYTGPSILKSIKIEKIN